MANPIKRFWEVDILRGIAIVMMIVFHLLFDLYYFRKYMVDVNSGFWLVFARITALIFIFLVGVSLTLSYSRARIKKKANFKKYLLRGLKIFGWGVVITAVTWIFLRESLIIFGILHFIGISIILAYPFIKLRFWNLVLGIVIIILGIYLRKLTFDFYWLMWLGFQPAYLYTFDYFPLLPWFGVVLIGVFFGNMFYKNNKRQFQLRDLSNLSLIKSFCFLGRNSLLIYLIHQPILILLLYLFVL